MAEKLVATLSDNIGGRTPVAKEFTKYAYWVSGPDARHKALEQYDLQRTGYVRVFVLQMPAFVEKLLPEETAMFKHMIEFGNVGIDGIQGYSVDTTQATGGYAGASIEMPTGSKDDTSGITIKMYETIESLVRTYIDFWITGTFDPYSGLSHYHGIRDVLKNKDEANAYYFSQANHTMEVLIVSTDPSGEIPLYSCMITNMFPKSSDHGHFNFDPGSHDLVQLSIEFTGTKYMSSQINFLGAVALKRFQIMKNFMLMYSGYSATGNNSKGFDYAVSNSHNVTEWFKNEDGSDLVEDRTRGGWNKPTTDDTFGTSQVDSAAGIS